MAWKETNFEKLAKSLGVNPTEVREKQKLARLIADARKEKGLSQQSVAVYQTKIISAPPEDRWKPIPILFDEQRFAVKILESGNFKRLLRLTMVKYFGPGVTLYAGRKGFSDLMLSRGQSFENISVWMGHSTLQRTWRSYKSRRKFHLDGY